MPTALFLFVGNKLDLRSGEGPTPEQFRTAVQRDTQCEYYECSALTQEGLTQVFEGAVRRVMEKRTGKKMGGGRAGGKGEGRESSCQMI